MCLGFSNPFLFANRCARIGVIILVKTTPNAICAVAEAAKGTRSGLLKAIILGTETLIPAIELIPKVEIPFSFKTFVSKNSIAGSIAM